MKKAISLLIIIALAASLVGCAPSEDALDKARNEGYKEGYDHALGLAEEYIDGYQDDCEEAMYWIEQYCNTGNSQYLQDAYDVLFVSDQWQDAFNRLG